MKRTSAWAAFWQKKQYVIAGTLVAIAAVGMTALYGNGQGGDSSGEEFAVETDTEQIADAALQGTETAEASKTSSMADSDGTGAQAVAQNTAGDENGETAGGSAETAGAEGAVNAAETDGAQVAEADNAEKTADSDAETQAVAQTAETLHFAAEDGILWPMEGNVILDYSMDSTVYFATLDQYKYNPAVIIAGDVNSKVYAVAKGQVLSVENDEVTGCTVTVDMGDGYEAVYGQLKELNFAEGDYVDAGQVIGYVSEPTKYFSVEGSNLYFAMTKDGVPVDPVEFFGAEQ